ncbi:hypothetical protein ABBQ38_000900 [Trebouxia sp. C0009 RCD-2024]
MTEQLTTNRGGSASTSESGLPRVFPAAAQPDVVRASQKDELYLHYLTDACHDAVRRLLGPRRALLWNRETAVAAQLLYHGLTTGAGVQTLGEEYCDILQVTGRTGVPPGTVQRGLLVLLQALLPHLADQLGGSTEVPLQPPPWASHYPDDSSTNQGQVQQQPWRVWVICVQQDILSRWRTVWHVLSQYSGAAMRLHLALFYFYGLYYHWSKRATGVRYMFIGKLFEHRPSYHLLGVLLFIQLGITSASWAIRNAMQSPLVYGSAAKHAAEAQLSSSSGAPLHREQKAVVLEVGVPDNFSAILLWLPK